MQAHDFASFTWQHLNFFQHHCLITARVPWVDCPDHGIKRAAVPWARRDSRFMLLCEQAALVLVREMPVAAGSDRRDPTKARFMGITDKRLWRVVAHNVGRAVAALDLRGVRAVGRDETASKRGHDRSLAASDYVAVFIERLWRSLKYEDVYLKGYADGGEAKAGIGSWIAFYNLRVLIRRWAIGHRWRCGERA